MRSNVATIAFLLLCLIIFGFRINACGENEVRDRFEYTERDFDAKIYGSIADDEVSAILKSRVSTCKGEYDITLAFESPDTIDGLVISHNTQTDTYEARLGELILHKFKADGLLEPFLTLLYHGEVYSVSRDNIGNTSVFVKQDGMELEYLFLKGSEYPYSITGSVGGRGIELFVESLNFV